MIIECPECGTKNTTDKPPQPDKRYRCGKCGASITFLQTTDSPRETTNFSATRGTGDIAAENTSGQGSLAVIPKEIRGWNWGAFLLGFIWGIGNKVWIAFLSLIPYFGFIWHIVLGVKGSEWAWRSKKWDSVEHFKRVQRTWTKWGVGVIVVLFILGIFASVVIPNVGRFIGRGETEAAATELRNIQAAVIGVMIDNGLLTLPNPVTIATNDMGAFPDATSRASSSDKQFDPNVNAYRRGDKAGYVLYQHDITGNGSSINLVDYVVTRYTKGSYKVDRNGTVTQVTTGYE